MGKKLNVFPKNPVSNSRESAHDQKYRPLAYLLWNSLSKEDKQNRLISFLAKFSILWTAAATQPLFYLKHIHCEGFIDNASSIQNENNEKGKYMKKTSGLVGEKQISITARISEVKLIQSTT